ncbi:hypothetical protein JVU11DRAFT_9479 [Chiua virens]|nr:hypothetical protein JVU11DRAFT_9479 [Chiua virens]
MSSTASSDDEFRFGISGRPRHGVELHPVDLSTWHDGHYWAPIISSGCLPTKADQSWPYRFQHRDSVWIHASDGKWYQGNVICQPKQGTTSRGKGLWWCVEFQMARIGIRKWCAPLNGDIKPYNHHTQALVSTARWVEDSRQRQAWEAINVERSVRR